MAAAAPPNENELALTVEDPNSPPPLLEVVVTAAGAGGCPNPDPALPNAACPNVKPLAEPVAAGCPKPAPTLCPNTGLPKPEAAEVPKPADPNAAEGAAAGG